MRTHERRLFGRRRLANLRQGQDGTQTDAPRRALWPVGVAARACTGRRASRPDLRGSPAVRVHPPGLAGWQASYGGMPRISAFLGIVIAMYFDDHAPPHFHALYSGESVSIGIDPLTVLAGRLPPRVLGYVIEWAALHQEELLADWALVAANQPPNPIPPLR